MDVELVDPSQVYGHWPKIEPLLKKALDATEPGFSVDDVFPILVNDGAQLWKMGQWRGLCVTQVTDLPQYRMLCVLYLAGEGMREWLPVLVEKLREFAQANGCRYAEIYGRKGWERVLGGRAFTLIRITVDERKKTDTGDERPASGTAEHQHGSVGSATAVPTARIYRSG